MARKRMIDPEFWSDEQIGAWSHAARLFYIGLWNFADDEGRFKAHAALLRSQIFPYDNTLDINALKKEIGVKVEWYEKDGSQYGYVRNFNKYQRIDRPSVSILPAPPSFVDESTNNHRKLDDGSLLREVKRKEVKRRAHALLDDQFLEALKTNPAYEGIDIDRELKKMDAWILTHEGRKKTRRFIVNWLNKVDKPLKKSETSPHKPFPTGRYYGK